jgi:hypothetical protein
MSPAVVTTAHVDSTILNESHAKKRIAFIVISVFNDRFPACDGFVQSYFLELQPSTTIPQAQAIQLWLLTEFLLLLPQLIDLLLLLKLLKLLLMLKLIELRPALRLVELFFLPELIELLFLSKLILLPFELKLV